MRDLAGLPVDQWLRRERADLLAATDDALTEDHRWLVLAVPSVAELRRSLPLLRRLGRVRRLVVTVTATSVPELLSIPPALAGSLLGRGDVRLVRGGAGGAVAEMRSRTTVPVHTLVHLLLSGPGERGVGSAPAPLRIGVTSPSALPWVAGTARSTLLEGQDAAEEPDGPPALDVPALDVPVLDVVAGDAPRPGLPWVDTRGTPSWSAAPPTWQEIALHRRPEPVSDRWQLPPVDAATVSPLGFQADPDGAALRLVRRRATGPHASLAVDAAGTVVSRLDPVAGIGEADVDALRPYTHVVADAEGAGGPVHLAVIVAHLLVAGVPVVAPGLPAATRRLLGPVARHLTTLSDPGDLLAREAWSVTVRREALQTLTVAAAWERHGHRLGLPAARPPTVSVLLATRRPDRLGWALRQVAAQTWPEVEVVVVLHGFTRQHPDAAAALAVFDRPHVVLEVGGDVLFGDALQAGTERCSGRFVSKMDDDDWYGPDHLTDQVLAMGYSGATVVGAKEYFTYLQGRDLTVRRRSTGRIRYTQRVAGGTLCIRRDALAEVGGWARVPRAVDRFLLAAVRAAGGLIHSTHGLGYCLYRGTDHTWAAADEHFLRSATDTWSGLRLPPAIPTGATAPDSTSVTA